MIAYMLTVSLTLGPAVAAEPLRLKLVSDSIRHKGGGDEGLVKSGRDQP